MTILAIAASFGAGGALIWFFKEKIQAIVLDAETIAKRLEDKAKAIKAAL